MMTETSLPDAFQCPYAPRGRRRCPPSICDCFVDTYPDDPFGLHPEAFLVNGHQYPAVDGPAAPNGHHPDCPGCTREQA